MKKTIIALAAASSVALSHGVAVADEGNTSQSSVQQNTNDSSELKSQLTGSSEKDKEETEGDKGSSAQDFFGWKDDASGLDKLIKIGAAVAAVVPLLGSISSLFANIEKIVKQFTK